MISRKDFMKEVASKTGYMIKDVETVMNEAATLICDFAKQHETVKAMNGFTFEGKTVAARSGRNPQTGEVIEIPEKTKIVCKFSKAVKDAIQ